MFTKCLKRKAMLKQSQVYGKNDVLGKSKQIDAGKNYLIVETADGI